MARGRVHAPPRAEQREGGEGPAGQRLRISPPSTTKTLTTPPGPRADGTRCRLAPAAGNGRTALLRAPDVSVLWWCGPDSDDAPPSTSTRTRRSPGERRVPPDPRRGHDRSGGRPGRTSVRRHPELDPPALMQVNGLRVTEKRIVQAHDSACRARRGPRLGCLLVRRADRTPAAGSGLRRPCSNTTRSRRISVCAAQRA